MVKTAVSSVGTMHRSEPALTPSWHLASFKAAAKFDLALDSIDLLMRSCIILSDLLIRSSYLFSGLSFSSTLASTPLSPSSLTPLLATTKPPPAELPVSPASLLCTDSTPRLFVLLPWLRILVNNLSFSSLSAPEVPGFALLIPSISLFKQLGDERLQSSVHLSMKIASLVSKSPLQSPLPPTRLLNLAPSRATPSSSSTR
mmetsp:Transcript_13539/g.27694  ORF Transcript_13539/g.27694 Transcript_13539/m.27694 type:complete len:201 (+) Transcript_13539:1170-1772(+)